MSLAFVFPGQGSQSVGMLGELAAAYPVINETLAEGSAALGYDLAQLMAAGPAETLNTTEYTQPVMLAAGVATWRLWKQQGGADPQLMSGHSLGEFTALVCADAIDFATALNLVRRRGQLMQSAVPAGTGSMAAILGLEDAVVEAVCATAAQGDVVEAVNYNSPAQVVIAGHASAVERAVALAKQQGAKRAMMLPVSVPSHSSLMRGAAEQLRVELQKIEMRTPRLRYLSAVDAAEHSAPDDIRATLVKQLASPVRWTSTVSALVNAGVTALIECGPGKVLTGLNRRIDKRPDSACLALENTTSLQAALQHIQGAPHA